MDAFMAVPCNYKSLFPDSIKWPWGPGTGEWPTGEKRLTQRWKWVYKCPGFASFTMIANHVWKRRRSYYFAYTTSGLKEIVVAGVIRQTPDPTTPTVCFYLGSYPIYWDGKYDVVTYAHFVPEGPRWPIGKKPTHPDIPGWTPTREQIAEYAARDDAGKVLTIPWGTDQRLIDKLDEWKTIYQAQFNREPTAQDITRMGYFYGIKWELPPPGSPFITKTGLPDPMWTSLDKQQQTIDRMDRLTDECIARNFTEKSYIPQKRISTPRGPVEWPGPPISQMTLPTPTRPPTPSPLGPPAQVLTLRLEMGFTRLPSPDGLEISLEVI